MPVIYLHPQHTIATGDLQSISRAFANATGIAEQHVHCLCIPANKQIVAGIVDNTLLHAQLILPDCNSQERIQTLLTALVDVLEHYTAYTREQLFIHVQLVLSGHVFADGAIETF